MRSRVLSAVLLIIYSAWSVLMLVFALVALSSLITGTASAQDFPPQNSVSPVAGTVTTGSLPVTVDWCDDHGIIQHSDSLNGVDITSSLTYVTATSTPPRCTFHRQSTGTLSLTPGSNRFVVYGIDSHFQGGPGTTIYRYTTVQVLGTYQPTTPQRSTIVDTFTVKNLLNSTQTFDLAAVCTGQLSGCSSPTSVTLTSLAQGKVAVSFATDTNGLAGNVYLKAWQSTNSALRDSAFYGVTAVPSINADFSFDNNDNQPAAVCATNCFAASASYATVPYVSLGTSRSVGLIYNGDQVAVRPFVYADVSIFPAASAPQEFWLQVKDSASGAFLPFTNGDATKVRYVGTLSPVRLVAQVDASQYPTSMRTIYVIVTAVRSTYNEQYNFTTKLRIVNERTSGLARGWTMGGMQRLYIQADGTALLTDGNGSATYFSGGCAAPCTLLSPPGDFTRLRATSLAGVTSYIREYVDSTKVFFRSTGLMDSLSDRFGNKTRFEYDGSNRLTKIYDPIRTYSGGTLRSYIALSYGTYGLTQIQEPGADGSPTGGRITHVRVAADSTLAAIVDPDGDSTRYTYDGNKRLQSVVDRAGNSQSYVYDTTSWKITSQTSPQVAVDAGGGSTVLATPTTTFYPWQFVGLPRTSTGSTPASPVSADSVRARVLDAIGNLVSFTVNRWGQPLIVTDALGQQTTFDLAGGTLPRSITHPGGGVDNFSYSNGLPTSIHPAGKDTTKISYGAYGQISQRWGSNQATVTNYIGTLGRIDSTRVGSRNFTTRYSYDSQGRITRVIDPGNDTVLTHYDSQFGNADSVTYPGGRYKWTRYDGRGRDSAEYVASGAVAITLYDSLGRVRQRYDGVHANPVMYTYDKLHLVRVQDSQHQVYRFAIDALGWRTAAYDPADTANRFISYRYRADGLLGSLTNRRGQRIDFRYDSAGRLISKRGPANVMADSFAYNAVGTIKVALNSNVTDSVFTDAITGWTDSTVTRLSADPSKRIHLTYRHDSQLRPTSVAIDPLAGIAFPSRTLNWDSGAALPTSVVLGTKTITFGSDNEGRRDSTKYEGALLRTDVYSTIHTISTSAFGNSVIDSAFWRSYGFDSLGRLSATNRHNGTGTAIQQYSYGKTAELTRQSLLTSTTPPDHCTGIGLKNDYGSSCLSLPTITQVLLGFKYDSVKNLIEERDSLASTSKLGKYGLGNRDTSWAGLSYAYDLDGNVQRRRSGADSVRFYWSADNRLDSVYSGGLRNQYLYNAMGQLISIKQNGIAQRFFVWGGGQILVELNGALDARVAEYVYYPNGTDRPLALVTGAQAVSATRYYQEDATGSVQGLVSLTSVAHQLDYNAWGEATITAGPTLSDTTRLRWKGLPWVGDSTQLYFVRSRWYDPRLRRFVSEDPKGIASTINQYAFGSNDPINMVDPEGTDDCRLVPGTMEDESGHETPIQTRVCKNDGSDDQGGLTLSDDGWSEETSMEGSGLNLTISQAPSMQSCRNAVFGGTGGIIWYTMPGNSLAWGIILYNKEDENGWWHVQIFRNNLLVSDEESNYLPLTGGWLRAGQFQGGDTISMEASHVSVDWTGYESVGNQCMVPL